MLSRTFLFVFLLFGLLFNECSSFSCSDFDSDIESCNADNRCIYDELNTLCKCGLRSALDIIFVIDASNSVEQNNANGWELEKAFVKSVIETGISEDSRVGIVTFNEGAKEHYAFTNDQNRDVISNYIDTSLGEIALNTHTRAAVQLAIDMFVRDSIDTNFGNDMLLILITDGKPYPRDTQNPTSDPSLKLDLDRYNIETIGIFVGNFDDSQLIGLFDDPTTEMMTVTSFDSIDISRSFLDEHTCVEPSEPEEPEIKFCGCSNTESRRRRLVRELLKRHRQ